MGFIVLACGAVAVAAGALGDVDIAAGSAAEDVCAKGAVSALPDGGYGPAMGLRHTVAVEFQILRGIEPEDVLYGAHN